MHKTKVMVNGLPGKMATKAAEYVDKAEDFELFPFSLTGPETEKYSTFINGLGIVLLQPDQRDMNIAGNPDIAVDFTLPEAVNSNVDFYCRNGWHSVIGTTGGDRDALEERVKDSKTVAVIAPNMGLQIVAYQSLMKDLANNSDHSDLLKGCNLMIIESHQAEKRDTSGTARAMVEDAEGKPGSGYLHRLGIPSSFTKKDIKSIRERDEQLRMGIPEHALDGHGWHTYIVYSDRSNPNLYPYFKNLKGFLLRDPVFSSYEHFTRPERGIFSNEEYIDAIIGDVLPELKNDDGIISSEVKRKMEMFFRYSKDKTVGFSVIRIPQRAVIFSHNVNGRDIYAEGTIAALRFLEKKIAAGEQGKVYPMMDVLRGR